MPKVRERARIGQEFAVLPWQQRHEEKEVPEGALYSVQSVDLFAPSATQVARDAAEAAAEPSDEDVTEEPDDALDGGGWITKDVTGAQPALTSPTAAAPRHVGDYPLAAAGASGRAPLLQLVPHEPEVTLAYAPGSGGGPELACGSDAETPPPEPEVDQQAEAEAADSPPELQGVCQLAITPSGRGMG